MTRIECPKSATNFRQEMKMDRHQRERDLERCLLLLTRFSLERTGWKRWIFGRWYYNHEPLRNDAANLVRTYGFNSMIPVNSRMVGDA